MSIQSVHRAIDILYLFSSQRLSLGVTEIGQLLGLSKTTVHGLVKSLAERGFLNQDPETRKYFLGLNIYDLNSTLSDTLKINQVGTPAAQRLAQDLRMLVRIAIWDQGTILITRCIFPDVPDFLVSQLGPRVPAYCSGIGKAVLAALPEEALRSYFDTVVLNRFTPHTIVAKKALKQEIISSRSRGYALDCEEFLPGVICIAAPIRDHSNQPIGGISISGGPEYSNRDDMEAHIVKLKQTAGEISRYMGHFPEMSSTNRAFWETAVSPSKNYPGKKR